MNRHFKPFKPHSLWDARHLIKIIWKSVCDLSIPKSQSAICKLHTVHRLTTQVTG